MRLAGLTSRDSLLVGSARVDITPPLGTWMQGYAVRDRGAEGIHDRLEATAVAMADGDTAAAVLTCDLIGLDFVTVERVRRKTAKLCGMDEKNLMIACSHTHGGPATGRRSYTRRDEGYMAVLEGQLATAVALAFKELRESSAHVGTGTATIGINRRAKREGKTVLGENPEGPIDRDVTALRFDDSEGDVHSLLFNHACHGTTLGGDNYLITADWMGYARRTVEAGLGGRGVLSGFINGAAGDVNPHPRGSFELARMHGRVVGGEVIKTQALAERIESPDLQVSQVEVDLPLLPPPSLDELRTLLRDLESAQEASKREGKASPELVARIRWTREMIQRVEAGKVKKRLRAEIQAIRIGTTALVGVPGEVFVEIGLRVKRRSPLSPTFLAGYCNGLVGYISTEKAIEEGGYEPQKSFYYLMEQIFAPEIEEVVVQGALEALELCTR